MVVQPPAAEEEAEEGDAIAVARARAAVVTTYGTSRFMGPIVFCITAEASPSGPAANAGPASCNNGLEGTPEE
jgi:hypothetical protein